MPSSLNGTGVTFNDGSTLQSGNIPTANMGSGTADSSTFLRGDRTFATVPASAPSTADVLNATANASAGAVGTYAWLGETALVTTAPGATRAGSALRYVGIISMSTSWAGVNGGIQKTNLAYPNAVSGTWRCMGHALHQAFVGYAQPGFPATLFLRIS